MSVCASSGYERGVQQTSVRWLVDGTVLGTVVPSYMHMYMCMNMYYRSYSCRDVMRTVVVTTELAYHLRIKKVVCTDSESLQWAVLGMHSNPRVLWCSLHVTDLNCMTDTAVQGYLPSVERKAHIQLYALRIDSCRYNCNSCR